MLGPHSPQRVVLKPVLCSQSGKPCSHCPRLWLVFPVRPQATVASREVVLATNDSAEGGWRSLPLGQALPPPQCHTLRSPHCTPSHNREKMPPLNCVGPPGTTFRESPHVDRCPGCRE